MSNKISGLRTTIYKVSDLEKATKWYANAFGVEPYFNEPFYVGFDIEGYELGLQPEEGEPAPKGENVFTYWGVDDIDAAFKSIVDKGAKPFEQPQEVGGGIKVAAVKDPWENIVGLIYNPHFKLK